MGTWRRQRRIWLTEELASGERTFAFVLAVVSIARYVKDSFSEQPFKIAYCQVDRSDQGRGFDGLLIKAAKVNANNMGS